MPLKLYHNPNSRAVIIQAVLEELGVPYTLENMAYEDGSLRSPAFLALNPMGKIPTLTDGDDEQIVVTEITAITIYLCDKYKSPNDLAPGVDDPQRGEYLRWVAFQTGAIDPAMMQAGAKIEVNRQQAGWGSADLVISVLKERLNRADPYLLGDRFTAADVVIACALGWAMNFELFPKEPELVTYVGRVMARPAMQRVFAAHGHASA